MNILYIADPNSIHDLKWIASFTQRRLVKAFILPRHIHRFALHHELPKEGIQILDTIPDFSILRFHRTLMTAFHIKKLVKHLGIDLIHILYAEPNALWTLFRWMFKVPIIISSRGTDVLKTIPMAFEKNTLIDQIVRRAYAKAFNLADYVTGTSGTQLESIKRFSGRTDKLSLVRTGIDVQRVLSDTTKHFPLDDGLQYILFPRYIKPIYNHEFSLDAITQLNLELKQKYSMVFVGKDNAEVDKAYQEMLIEKMNSIKDVNFIFLPEVPQETIFELYKRAALVVMNPLSDGSPVSAMEAIACGSKVILGPIKYDDEIFKGWTKRLQSWSSEELATLIADSLANSKKVDNSDFFSLVDRNGEMKKMESIYSMVLTGFR